jgi:hypothetical protein
VGLVVGLALTCIISSFAQTQTAIVARRDQSAVEVVTQALSVMGGSAAWSQISSATVTGNCASSATQSAVSANFRWTTQGAEFRYETDTDNSGPIFLSAHGQPFIAAASGNVSLSPEYRSRMLPFHLPGIPLQTALSDSTISIRLIGNEMLKGNPAIHVRIAQFRIFGIVRGAVQDWWFDPGSGLPIQVGYLIPSQADGVYGNLTWSFDGWSTQGTLLLPYQLLQSVSGAFAMQSCTVNAVQTNTNPAASIFDAR